MQGFNMGRYVPPEHEGVLSFNQVSHKKTSSPTVRFEMPYAIWCGSCAKPTIIGQGVRFNAEKKKVGNYYSTPIFAFRFKHTACSGWIEIRTDPQNTAYVVTEGATKRDLGDDVVRDGDREILTTEERERMRADAFASLEVKIDDRARLEQAKTRIEELREVQRQWDDPYELNRRLRKEFRVGRKEREQEAGRTEALQERMSLGVDLLPEHEDDRRRARLIDFQHDLGADPAGRALAKPLFAAPSSIDSKKAGISKSRKSRTAAAVEKRKEGLIAEITGNTRVKLDPFLVTNASKSDSRVSLGVKRKNIDDSSTHPDHIGSHRITSLVDYDSE